MGHHWQSTRRTTYVPIACVEANRACACATKSYRLPIGAFAKALTQYGEDQGGIGHWCWLACFWLHREEVWWWCLTWPLRHVTKGGRAVRCGPWTDGAGTVRDGLLQLLTSSAGYACPEDLRMPKYPLIVLSTRILVVKSSQGNLGEMERPQAMRRKHPYQNVAGKTDYETVHRIALPHT